MVGFEDSVNMAEECRNPVRIFPRAMLLGMAVAGTIYVAVAVLSSTLVPADVLAEAKSSALFRVLEAGAPGFPLAVFAVIGLFAVINSALINMLMASRLLYGMSNERILPRIFGRVHEGRRTPWFAILFTSVVAIILVASADITLLGGTTALLLLGVFTIVNIAVLVLRRDTGGPRALPGPELVAVGGHRAVRFPRHAAVGPAAAAVRRGRDPARGRRRPLGDQLPGGGEGRRRRRPACQGLTGRTGGFAH